jgi:organic radical activating enzyme
MKTYAINEVFYSLQGEGARAGTANVFIRFAGCNLTCKMETHGFDCDTEFASGRKLTLPELLKVVKEQGGDKANAVILTGGEPLLQVDEPLINALLAERYFVAIETNGTCEIPKGIDWVTVSPKVAEHAVMAKRADEIKYVRHYGQEVPKPRIEAAHYYLSPAWAPGEGFGKNLEWCINLCKENPKWALSIQQHKIWGVR